MAKPGAFERLEALVDMMTPEIREAFLFVMQDIVDNAIIVDMIEAIERGDIDAAFRAVGFSDAAMRPLTAAIENAFEQGGIFTGETFQTIATALRCAITSAAW